MKQIKSVQWLIYVSTPLQIKGYGKIGRHSADFWLITQT